MFVVTSKEMRLLDEQTIRDIGIPSLVLMENAGRAIAEEVLACLEETGSVRRSDGRIAQAAGEVGQRKGLKAEPQAVRVIVLTGKGNNGGDGFVAARHLAEAGIGVDLVLAEPAEKLAGEAAVQYGIAQRLGIPASEFAPGAVDWGRYAAAVDALLGTGSRGAPREPYAELIREANASKVPIVAADIPSGLDADTGETHEPCIRAERTAALAFVKRGLVQHPGAEAAGRLVVRPIGIPPELAEAAGVRVRLLDGETLRQALDVDPNRSRRADTHKGSYGHALVAAGSLPMSGAGLLCAKAALREGCGLLTWAVPAGIAQHLLGRLPEAMLAGVADGGRGDWANTQPAALLALAEGRDAVALGPGLGRFTGDAQWLRAVWEGCSRPLVLDADALNMLADAEDFAAWPKRQAATILTPHPGEMARLAGLTVREVQRDRIGLAQRFAERHGVTLALKGAGTVVADSCGSVYVNTTGNPGMATGGSGDVLAGVIVSLLAQGLTGLQAAACGVWLHGAAGDRAAAKRRTPGSLIAGDIIEEL